MGLIDIDQLALVTRMGQNGEHVIQVFIHQISLYSSEINFIYLFLKYIYQTLVGLWTDFLTKQVKKLEIGFLVYQLAIKFGASIEELLHGLYQVYFILSQILIYSWWIHFESMHHHLFEEKTIWIYVFHFNMTRYTIIYLELVAERLFFNQGAEPSHPRSMSKSTNPDTPDKFNGEWPFGVKHESNTEPPLERLFVQVEYMWTDSAQMKFRLRQFLNTRNMKKRWWAYSYKIGWYIIII